MRNLRTELQNASENGPIAWDPADGDILVGTVRDASATTCSETMHAVVIEEERTGVPVLVSLDSPQLAALFELHRPRPNERVGIKCAAPGSDGSGRFIMIVDRDTEPEVDGAADAPLAQATDEQLAAEGDFDAATPEERDFIEKMLSGGSGAPEPQSARDGPSARIQGVMKRSEEDLDGQVRALERLEALITQSPPDHAVPSSPSASPGQPQPSPAIVADRGIDAAPKPKRGRLRAALITLALVSASAAAIGYAYFHGLLGWVAR